MGADEVVSSCNEERVAATTAGLLNFGACNCNGVRHGCCWRRILVGAGPRPENLQVKRGEGDTSFEAAAAAANVAMDGERGRVREKKEQARQKIEISCSCSPAANQCRAPAEHDR